MIVAVEENSHAEKAKLKRLELIKKIGETPIKNANNRKNTVANVMPDEKVKIKRERDNKVKTFDVTNINIDQKEAVKKGVVPTTNDSRIKGLSIDTLSDEHRYRFRINKGVEGVLILDVENDSDAQKFGFKKGDVIVQVEQHDIKSVQQLNDVLKNSKKKMIRVLVSRGGYISPILVK